MNILILEDNEADVELVKRELRQAGFQFLACWAQDKATFTAALERSAPDLILVDYALPGFDGLTALALVRQRWADVPVIIVSGAIGEEMAIDTLKAGATDYVLKQRLSRLGPAVRRAMDEASERTRRRQAQESLRASEERYRRFFEEDLAGDFVATPDGQIVESDPAFAEIYGFADPQTVTRYTIAEFNPEDWADLVARVRTLRRIRNHQCTHRRPDGKQIHVVMNAVGRFTESGELAEVVGYVLDDTERKQAEHRL